MSNFKQLLTFKVWLLRFFKNFRLTFYSTLIAFVVSTLYRFKPQPFGVLSAGTVDVSVRRIFPETKTLLPIGSQMASTSCLTSLSHRSLYDGFTSVFYCFQKPGPFNTSNHFLNAFRAHFKSSHFKNMEKPNICCSAATKLVH